MNATFWIGIAIGGVLSLFASLVANFFTPSFAGIIDKTKAGWIERSRKKALARYSFIEAMHSGRRDKQLDMTRRWTATAILSQVGMTVLILSYLVSDNPSHLVSAKTMYRLLGIVIFISFFMVMFWLRLIERRLNNFDVYKVELERRWGALPPTPEA